MIKDLLVMLDEGAIMPTRAHASDAGLDLLAPNDFEIPCHGGAVIDTGVHILIPDGYVGQIESKSGLNVRCDIVSCGGTIDAGYTGSIRVKLYNLGGSYAYFARGQKIAQLVIYPIETPALTLTTKFPETERGDRGFGSTGAY